MELLKQNVFALFKQLQVQQGKPLSTLSNLSSTNQERTDDSAKSTPNVGKTWSDLGALNIDIDFKTVKPTATKNAAPSLIQLQSLKQNQSLTQPTLPQKNLLGKIINK